MKHIVTHFLIVFLGSTHFLFAQNIPVNRYPKSVTYREMVQARKESIRPFELTLGYTNIGMLNEFAGSAKESGFLKYKGGVSLGLACNIYPVKLETKFYGGSFSLGDEPSNVYGTEIGASLMLPPLSLELSRFFIPYLGISYDYLKFDKDVTSGHYLWGIPANGWLGTNTEAIPGWRPFWKAGTMLNMGKNFFINVEYKKVFPNRTPFPYQTQQFHCALGFRGEAAGAVGGGLLLAALIAAGTALGGE